MIDNYLLVGITRAANTAMMVGAMAFGIVLGHPSVCDGGRGVSTRKFSELSMIPHDPYYVYAIAAAIAGYGDFSMIFQHPASFALGGGHRRYHCRVYP